jgi:hypothetical protein
MCSKLGYSTVKTVKIYDPLLATMHYTFMLGIFVYIVVILVVKDLGYCAFEEPLGTARVSVQPPTVGTPSDPTFDPDDPGYEYAFVPADQLPYCRSYTGATAAAITQEECLYMGAIESVFPVTGGSPFFLTTRVRESNQTLVCRSPPGACEQTYAYACDASFEVNAKCDVKAKWPQGFAQRTYFIADVESFTLLVDHSVRAPQIGLASDSSEMSGQFEFCNGTTMTPQETDQGQSFFTVQSLLDGAKLEDGSCGLDLDTQSVMGPSARKSARYDGIVMSLEIEYYNTKPWSGPLGHDVVQYTMRTSVVNGTKSKVEDELWKDYPTKRVTRNRHGIKLIVVQSGNLGAFSFSALLTTLTGSLALLAVSTTGVDVLALYVLRRKDLYRAAKYDLVDEATLDREEEAHRKQTLIGGGFEEGYDYEDMGSGAGGRGRGPASETEDGARVAPRSEGGFKW